MEFIDPPKEARGERSKRWKEIVATLKKNPGEWALVGNFSPGVATHIRRGQYKAFHEGWEGDVHQLTAYMERNWEVTTRKTDTGSRNDIYIRWLG
jgi:hypothetical protein